MLAKKTSTSPNAILPKKVARVAPSDTELRPRTGPITIVGPKEFCVRVLPKKLKAVEFICALKNLDWSNLIDLHIKRSEFENCSSMLEFQSHDSARAAVEAEKIKYI
ncbi:hypothetical protein RND71_012497 [Anisodus tanguticus]|uniref:Uncharacterized protein n=1 Tax=Anisodus tanguticus TaxID=243964 RepID=A0AAE1SFA4_9SOLA|nr:hypothetical protein RND71_012497 [Anisodus tanguticus]